ncbi:HAD-IC family P-type ATPase [Nonomuraea sp. NN258]|uniref:HAD-IC family P-type ATPase n=1 Tax=Nonomuraea antri TaxID=2730852 RepID=UPI001568BC7E|nr:HAD-IC family P-type ATPase [Nonomuraea antri]NRQ38173.1 HAD-IC family P-type ATPase [Nonomuraea antri]
MIEPDRTPWHALPVGEVAAGLGADPEQGLAAGEAARRLERHGPNQFKAAPRDPRWRAFLRQFQDLMILILLVAAVVSLLISGEWETPLAIAVVVLLNATIGFVQESRAEASLEALRRMTVTTATVRRHGRLTRLDAKELVPGDLVVVEAGDRVPADGRLLSAASLEVQESELTGEAQPAVKSATAPVEKEAPPADRTNALFMNTSVTRGRGEMLVTATGMATETGRIADLLATAEPAPTPLQRQINALSRTLALISAVVVAVVIVLGLIRGQEAGVLFVTAVSLAVAAIPEGLPAVVAFTLAMGTDRLARHGAIVKRLSSVETLGSTSQICTDKTGTFALVCGAAVLVGSSTVMAFGNQPDARPLDPLGWALLAAMALALAWLPGRPAPALAVSAGAAAAFFALGHALALWPVPALIALFCVIAAGHRAAGWTGAAFLIAVPALAVVVRPELDRLVATVVWALIVLVVAQPAEVSRARRAYTAEVERRAADAERTREEEALRRAQEERLRVARELHDVTSHTVSVIALHAAVAAEAVDRAGGPAEARAAIEVIRTASRQALAEMKTVLGVLRPDTGPGPGPGSSDARRPLPGVGRLPALLENAGLPVALHVAGPPRPLPPAADLTVYRVVQEALTNTLRHAGATRSEVTLTYEAEGVTVRIDDDGHGLAVHHPGENGHAPGGHGLTGMAERVAAVGGRLTTGDGPHGGFRVTAWLPA